MAATKSRFVLSHLPARTTCAGRRRCRTCRGPRAQRSSPSPAKRSRYCRERLPDAAAGAPPCQLSARRHSVTADPPPLVMQRDPPPPAASNCLKEPTVVRESTAPPTKSAPSHMTPQPVRVSSASRCGFRHGALLGRREEQIIPERAANRPGINIVPPSPVSPFPREHWCNNTKKRERVERQRMRRSRKFSHAHCAERRRRQCCKASRGRTTVGHESPRPSENNRRSFNGATPKVRLQCLANAGGSSRLVPGMSNQSINHTVHVPAMLGSNHGDDLQLLSRTRSSRLERRTLSPVTRKRWHRPFCGLVPPALQSIAVMNGERQNRACDSPSLNVSLIRPMCDPCLAHPHDETNKNVI